MYRDPSGKAPFSDSMMAVKELRTAGTVVLAQWILSYVCIKGNEDADNLANQEREEEQPEVPAFFSDCKAAMCRRMAELWEAAFRRDDDNSIPEVRKLALRVRDPLDPLGEQLPRGKEIQAFRMRAEHTLLMRRMSRTKWTSDPSCRLCGFEVESTVHVLFSSPALEMGRDPSIKAESDLAMFLWGSLAQLKAAAKLIDIFVHKVER